MKTLRDKLEEILPNILPDKADKAIKGAELAQSVLKILTDEKESTIRQTFSAMHTDATSVLAKIPNKQGFYKRPSITAEQSKDPTAPTQDALKVEEEINRR